MSDKARKQLDKIDTKLDSVVECQIRIEKDLEYHIKRTDILEDQLKPIVNMHNALKLVSVILGALILFKEQILSLLGVV